MHRTGGKGFRFRLMLRKRLKSTEGLSSWRIATLP